MILPRGGVRSGGSSNRNGSGQTPAKLFLQLGKEAGDRERKANCLKQQKGMKRVTRKQQRERGGQGDSL